VSTYRRRADGKTQRWKPRDGEWVDVPDDEPETRVRVNEGMVICRVPDFSDTGPLVVSVADLLAAVGPEVDAPIEVEVR
jgi:hypothetical protein